MAVKDYQLEAGLNVSISGINIAEGCPPSGINDAIRQLMADVKAESNARQQAESQNAKAVEQASQSVTSLGTTLRSEMDSAVAGAKSEAASADATLESTLRSLVASEKTALEAQISNAVPVGTVIAFAANAAPEGYLLCNGAKVSRTTYAALFSAIGTTYGTGNGSSTFTLPNLTDKFIQGSGTAGTSKAAGLPDHKHLFEHTQSFYYSYQGTDAFFVTEFQFEGNTAKQFPDQNLDSIGNASASNSIYGKSSTVQPPALTMRYYIKY